MTLRASSAVRAAVAALAGALFVTAVAVQPAAADHHDLTPPEILSASVHGGRTIVLGPRQTLVFQATVVARAAAGIHRSGVELTLRAPGGLELDADQETRAVCSPVNATTSVCSESFRLDTGSAAVTNAWATDWSLSGLVASNNIDTDPDSSITSRNNLATTSFRRASRLAFTASPNPVRQGRDVGALGRLTVADWETDTYAGAPGQSVALDFCATPCRTVESLRTLTTGTSGLTGTTHPATRDGSWWLRFDGTARFAPVYSPGVVVDVQ